MTATAGLDPAAAALAVAGECARAYQDVFTERLAAVYLMGSLAYGGYAPAVSDIDLAVILTGIHDEDPAAMASMGDTLRRRGPLHRKLSVFWCSLPALREGQDDGRFPALDRLELSAHGRLLLGDDVAGQATRPTARELLLESSRFAIDVLATDEVTDEFRRPDRLLSDPVWFTKAVLFPVRFLYTTTNTDGRAATNDEAVAWYLAHPQSIAPSLVRLAADVRAGRPLDPAAAAPELAAGLCPLYRHYIDEQTRLLRRSDAPADIVRAFAHWHERLS